LNIIKTSLPASSVLNGNYKKYDYIDSYQGTVTDYNNNIDSNDICKAFFYSAPRWIEKLLDVRNSIVAVLGLKTSDKPGDPKTQLENFKCEPGEQLGLFKVYSKNENEVILGEDDKHLNFRVSLFLDGAISEPSRKIITISTTVEYNNWFGRIYFLPVRPFHKLIVPAMLKGIIKDLEKRNL